MQEEVCAEAYDKLLQSLPNSKSTARTKETLGKRKAAVSTGSTTKTSKKHVAAEQPRAHDISLPPASYYHQHLSMAVEELPSSSGREVQCENCEWQSCKLFSSSKRMPGYTGNLQQWGVPPRLQQRWLDTTKAQDIHEVSQQQLFGLLNSYKDVLLPTVPSVLCSSQSSVDTLLLHIVNHCAHAADAIRKNNESFKSDAPPQAPPRDQGFTRAKALLLLPMRNSAHALVARLCSLAQRETRADSIQNKQRFREEFGPREDDDEEELPEATRRALQRKPVEHKALFAGNTDDHFRVGIRITRGAVKLYADFFQSDIVVASPLGLVTMIEEQSKAADGALDWMSSLEVVALLQCEVMLMQNWAHVGTVLSHLNQLPSKQHDVDIMRVREGQLAGKGAQYRQLVMFSAMPFADLNATFAKHAHSYEGRCRYMPLYRGVLGQVVTQVRQLFQRLPGGNGASGIIEADVRFSYFKSHVWPRIKESAATGQLLFIPSYLDYVRVRRFLDAEEASWDAITEYTPPDEAAQIRSSFSSGKRRVLVYTERAHFYHRYVLHGVQDCCLYQLPHHAHYYSELLNMLALPSASGSAAHSTVTVLFGAMDALQLQRVVGSKRVQTLLKSKAESGTFLFC